MPAHPDRVRRHYITERDWRFLASEEIAALASDLAMQHDAPTGKEIQRIIDQQLGRERIAPVPMPRPSWPHHFCRACNAPVAGVCSLHTEACLSCGHRQQEHNVQGCLHQDAPARDFCPCRLPCGRGAAPVPTSGTPCLSREYHQLKNGQCVDCGLPPIGTWTGRVFTSEVPNDTCLTRGFHLPVRLGRCEACDLELPICQVCQGAGVTRHVFDAAAGLTATFECEPCHGDGFLDDRD